MIKEILISFLKVCRTVTLCLRPHHTCDDIQYNSTSPHVILHSYKVTTSLCTKYYGFKESQFPTTSNKLSRLCSDLGN